MSEAFGAAPRIAAYLLAGGRSSRMGQDKALLTLGGRTLLSLAVEKVRSIPMLAPKQGEARVTLLGERVSLEGADRSIADNHPGCGPLGGIEAALEDLAAEGDAELAFFLPVDMPFVPATLLNALLTEWLQGVRGGALTCWCVVGGKPQPLVSLVHRRLLPCVADAIREKRYRVAAVMQEACLTMAETHPAASLEQTVMLHEDPQLRRTAWSASLAEERLSDLWFANLNTPAEFLKAESRVAEGLIAF